MKDINEDYVFELSPPSLYVFLSVGYFVYCIQTSTLIDVICQEIFRLCSICL